MEHKKSLVKNSVYKTILNVCNVVIPVIVFPYVYRVLSPDTMGSIDYVNTVYHFFSLFGILGISAYGLREVSKIKNNSIEAAALGSSLFSIGVFSNICILIVYLSFIHLKFDSDIYTISVIFALNFISNIFNIEWINEVYENYKFITIKSVLVRILNLILIFVLVREEKDLIKYVFITVFALFLNNIISFFYIKHRLLDLKFKLKKTDFRLLLPPLLFILVLGNSNVLFTMFDRILLGEFSGFQDVAYYTAGQKITEVIKSFLLVLVLVSVPRLSYNFHNDRERYYSLVIRLFQICTFIVIPTAITMAVLNREIITMFAGLKYAGAEVVLSIFSIRLIILVIESIIAYQIIFIHGKEKVLILINFGLGIFHVLLAVIFLKYITPELLIALTMFSELFIILIEFRYIKTRLKIHINFPNKDTLRYVLCSLIIIPIVIVCRRFSEHSILVVAMSSAIFIIFYTGMLCLFKDKVYLYMFNQIKARILPCRI